MGQKSTSGLPFNGDDLTLHHRESTEGRRQGEHPKVISPAPGETSQAGRQWATHGSTQRKTLQTKNLILSKTTFQKPG